MIHRFSSRRKLHTALADAQAENAQLNIELDDLSAQNDALERRLDTARIEINAVQAERDDLRGQLVEARRGDPLHRELQDAKRQVASLAQRLAEMQDKSTAADQPPQVAASSLALDRPFA